jgi:hypothetical protein
VPQSASSWISWHIFKIKTVTISSFALQNFIEEKEFLAQLDTSFQRCGEVFKNLGKVVQFIFDRVTFT